MLKIKDIIEKLRELNEEDYFVNIEVEPIINCYEQFDGNGYEEIKYRYTIILENKNPTIRRYENKNGVKNYKEK